ncbi:competence protein ComF [Staphylococcus gallinarum]|uniref:Competence protein ComF n=1 Tax=Staphylococcus gallinarum TaxID=1293 RepID=A0A380FE11_STAGA|nr:competence protein ComF [Staphylococcus gallinarum]
MDYREKQANLPKSNRINARNPFHVIDDIDLTHAQVLLVDDILYDWINGASSCGKAFY